MVATTGGVITSPTSLQPPGNSSPSLKVGESYTNPYEIGKGGLDFIFKTGIVLNKKIEIYLDTTPFSLGFSSNATSTDSAIGITGSGAYSYKNMVTSIGFNYFFESK